jgi:hypothetical protein
MQAGSGERSEHDLSSQSQRRDARQTAQRASGMDPGHHLSTRDLDLYSSDEWQTFTAETIEIRKMIYTYRNKVLGTPDDG